MIHREPAWAVNRAEAKLQLDAAESLIDKAVAVAILYSDYEVEVRKIRNTILPLLEKLRGVL